MIASLLPACARYPTAFSQWLCAADLALHTAFEVAILGDLSSQPAQALTDALWSQYRPNLVAAISPAVELPHAPPLLLGRTLLDGQPTAYVCQDFVCRLPVTNPEDLLKQLEG
jgi:uncharacterized protein YyaL (SSP411 family)